MVDNDGASRRTIGAPLRSSAPTRRVHDALRRARASIIDELKKSLRHRHFCDA
jgi:hypothetical protein